MTKMTLGTNQAISYECQIDAVPVGPTTDSRYGVILTIASPDRTRDNPIRVLIPNDHALRLIKELASSVLADTN
jgi:hypothetical protein